LHPTLIGVDVLFQGEKDEDEDFALTQAVRGLKSPIVFSCKLLNYDDAEMQFTDIIEPYFIKDINVALGYTNITDNMEKATIRELTLEQQCNGKRTLSFPARIYEVLGYNIKSYPQSLTINYLSMIFPKVNAIDVKENDKLIKDKIVLVGDLKDESDMHLTPIGKLSGLNLQAYSLLTLLTHKTPHIVPKIINWILCFILCYIFTAILFFVDKRLSSKESKFKIFLKESKLPNKVIPIIWFALISFIGFLAFSFYGIYFDIILILSVSVFVIECKNIYIGIKKAYNNKSTTKK